MKQFRKGLAVLLAVLLVMPTLPAYAEGTADTGTEISSVPAIEGEAITESESSSESEAITESESTSESEAITESESSSESEAITESESSSESEAITERESSGESEAITESESSSESEAITESESFSESDTLAETAAMEEVLFNTGNCAFHVVDQASYENGIGDTFFAEDGSYTISIPEVNPFFPYEVQFTYGGEVTKQWFMTPDDSVEIGGHTFYVSAYFDDTVMTQLSLNVAGDIIVVYPEEKEFTDGDGIMPISLLPLEEKRFSQIDLTGYTPIELSMISIDQLMAGNVTVEADDKIIWRSRYYSDQEYTVSGTGDKIDLSHGISSSSSSQTFELIVGEADQLAADNIRYILTANLTPSDNWLVPKIAVQNKDESRRKIEVTESEYYISSYNSSYFRYLSASCKLSDVGNNLVYISLSLNKESFPEADFTLKAFEGSFDTAEAAMAGTEITDQIFAKDVMQPNAGLQIFSYGYSTFKNITLVAFNAEGGVMGILPLEIYFRVQSNGLGWSFVEEKETEGGYSNWIDVMAGSSIKTQSDDSKFYELELYKGYPADREYTLSLSYHILGSYDNSNESVTAVYLGNFSSIAEAAAANAEEISDKILYSGYKADYSQGVYFSVFVGEDGSEGQEVYRYCYKTIEGDREKPSYDTSDDTSLTLYGGLYGPNKSYVIGYLVSDSLDSYGENNFYTILVGPDVDLTNLAPTFYVSSRAKLYAEGSGTPEVSGESYHDFSKGAVQYTVSAEDGKTSKNYWLRIISATEGAGKLYMNSLDDPDVGTKEENGVIYTTRAVMLDSYHDGDIHNILLANIGTEAIPALSAELVSDVVELDSYWTLKGNHELSGFSTVYRETSYGELPNLAKVVLRAKEGVENGTDISGTLTLKSGETTLMVITLTGTVGNPSITTKEIPAAVKYVPYGTMIQNSNKYSWNKVTYELYSGYLPSGMEIKPNGELYGVPTETGTFTFTVRMNNSGSSYNFSADIKTFTLIINENTDENVDAATDEGYELSTKLDKEVDISAGSGASYTMVSEGVFDEFVDLYLDGVKLVLGQDYDAAAGSTRITIKGQTLLKAGEGKVGTHTLGIEFRTQDTDSLKRAAQNFNLVDSTKPAPAPDPAPSPSSGNNNGGGQGESGATLSPTAQVSKDNTASETVSYTVVSGDSLWKIAKKFYGDGSQWRKIFADNADVLKDEDVIYAGQVLTIYLNGTSAADTKDEEKTSGTDWSGKEYTVESGDSLWKISQKVYGNGSEWRKIYSANENVIGDPSKIYTGQVLVIPE